MTEVKAGLIKPQLRFLKLPHAFRAYVAGFGSGKTWAGGAGGCAMAWSHPKVLTGYFAPTYKAVKDIYFPTIEEVAHSVQLRCVIRRGDLEVDLYHGNQYRSTVICRSMKDPDSIVGFKIARAQVDEIDTLGMDHATAAWRKIIARLRVTFPGQNGVDVTTTPEGFRFVYETWVKAVKNKPELGQLYGMVQASTYENQKHLPPGYIESLVASYPANLIDAYLHGKFVNLTQGRVYPTFDRKLNGSSETVQGDEVIHIGVDFNIGKMSGVVHVIRNEWPHAVWEFVNLYDTPTLIKAIQDKYWEWDGQDYKRTRQIRVYPDASGKNRSRLGFSESDIGLLKEAGFIVLAPKANPPVKSRVTSVNALFCNAKGERHYRVNTEACPTFTEDLEQQAYDKSGEPDKANDRDHRPDAAGYFIYYKYPVVKPATRINMGIAV